jgi:hypothetical protein
MSADEAEDDGAYEEEGAGYGDVAYEELPFCAASPPQADGTESAIRGTTVEFRIAHRHQSLFGRP